MFTEILFIGTFGYLAYKVINLKEEEDMNLEESDSLSISSEYIKEMLTENENLRYENENLTYENKRLNQLIEYYKNELD
jgi:hypothetical protein